MSKLTICNIIAVRNEYPYLKTLLPFLAKQNIEVIIIDNDSNDGSAALFRQYKGYPIINVIRQPYRGYFSLTEQLELKYKIIKTLTHDWVVHQDADEILENRTKGLNLRDSIEIADLLGYNCINFEEFVFLPTMGRDYSQQDYYREMKQYYFFEPSPKRLQRAFKVSSNLDNRAAAGHKLIGNVKCYPESQTLRHYISLSQEKLFQTYTNRTFDPIDLKKGWHRRRTLMNTKNMTFSNVAPRLLSTKHQKHELNRSKPYKVHFWQWEINTLQPTAQSWVIEDKSVVVD